eukprot:43556_1
MSSSRDAASRRVAQAKQQKLRDLQKRHKKNNKHASSAPNSPKSSKSKKPPKQHALRMQLARKRAHGDISHDQYMQCLESANSESLSRTIMLAEQCQMSGANTARQLEQQREQMYRIQDGLHTTNESMDQAEHSMRTLRGIGGQMQNAMGSGPKKRDGPVRRKPKDAKLKKKDKLKGKKIKKKNKKGRVIVHAKLKKKDKLKGKKIKKKNKKGRVIVHAK